MKKEKRGSFASNLGFILAAAGSAIGLGNIWRFPYLAAKYGGGTFLIIYIILAITFGFSVMVTEVSIGRKTGLSCVGAFEKLHKHFKWLGIINALVPVLILPYYCLIGGWVMKYAVTFIIGDDKAAAKDGYFGAYISGAQNGIVEPLLYFAIFMLLTSFVIGVGVQKGVERSSKILMPILFILVIIVAVFTCTLPNAGKGIAYYLKPDIKFLNAKTILAACGQLFYSLSLAMGIMITYGSYMPKTADLEQSCRRIDIFDTAIAFLAGLMIIPAVYVFSNGDMSAMNAGPGLMFMTLPKVFDSMAIGRIIGALFFSFVFFAALTSSISIEEAVVSQFCDQFHWTRRTSMLIATVYSIIVGGLCSLGYGPLDFIQVGGMALLDLLDYISNSVLMPIVAISICIFTGFFIKTTTIRDEVESSGHRFFSYKFYAVMIKWVSPIFLAGILITSVLSGLGLFSF
jgi:NSS family neurotransmitter:Na+ symporter